jgi:hypothetical protein
MTGGGERRSGVGQQPGVRIAVGEVPDARRDLQRPVVARGEHGTRQHATAAPPGSLDHAAVAQQPVGGGDRVGIDAQLAGEIAQRRQRGTRLQHSRRHQ